eukprot:3361650-Rhodomonas_salina.1
MEDGRQPGWEKCTSNRAVNISNHANKQRSGLAPTHDVHRSAGRLIPAPKNKAHLSLGTATKLEYGSASRACIIQGVRFGHSFAASSLPSEIYGVLPVCV